MSAFDPQVLVLSAEPANPEPPARTLDAVLGRFPGVAEAHAVCWTGSSARGWSNRHSDLDLYVFADTEITLPSDESVESWTSTLKSGAKVLNWMGQFGGVLADVKVWPTDLLGTVLAPYLDDTEPELCGVAPDMMEFLYRMSIAMPVLNPEFFDAARSTIRGSRYANALSRSIKVHAENSNLDVLGQLEAGDILGARYTAQLSAAYAADMCLVLAGDICRSRKWLLRRLSETPECGISAEEYQSEVLDGPRPGESVADSVMRIALWSQRQIVRVEPDALSTVALPVARWRETPEG